MKKKFTMLFAALLAFVGVANAQTVITDVASLTDDMECTVATSGRGGWAVNAEKNQFGSTNDYGFGKTVDLTNDQHIFQFKTIEDKVYLYSLSAEKFVNKDRSLSETATQAIEFIAMDGPNAGKFVVKFDNNAFINLGGSFQMVINSWGANAGNEYDAGNMVTITDVTELRKASEEYIALTGLIGTAEALAETVNKYIGNAIGEYPEATATALATAISTAKALDKNEVKQSHVDALQTAMDAVKIILPTVGQYYQIHSALTAFATEQGAEIVKAVYSNGTQPRWKTLDGYDKSFYWLAVAAEGGNVVFQNAADGKYMVANAGQSGAWSMADAPTAASNISVKIFSKEANAKGYEYGVIMNNWQMHCNGHGNGKGTESNIVSYNTNSANSASSWFLVPVELPTFYTVTYNFQFGGDTKYTQTAELASGAAFPAMNVFLPYGVTSDFALPEGTVSENVVENFALTVEHELPFVAAADVNSIDTWYYAQMHANSAVTAYVQDDQNAKNNVDWNDKSVEAAEIDSHLWGFVGDVWSGIKMVNKGTGRAIVSTSGDAVMGDAANATAFIPTYSTGAYRNGWFCLKYPESNYLNAQNGKIASWGDADNGSSFFLTEYNKEYSLNITAAQYATYYSQYRLAIPETVKAYVVAETNEGYAVLEQVTGVLPAYTGVILEGEGVHTFVTSAAETATIASNKLQGSIAAQEVTVAENKVAYILANKNGVGLYKVALTDGKFTNGANKAYMVLDKPVAGEAPAMFSFGRGEGTTGIETAVSGEQTVVIYDLSGRRVEKMEKGIYIVNGKKVIR